MKNRERHKALCRLAKWPIGRILLDGEFISAEDLDRALGEQRRTNELLGEVLVRLGLLSTVDLNAALSIQREIVSCEGAYRAAFGIRQMLGEILLRAKRVTEEQLSLALEEQKKTGGKLGEVLLRQGRISKEELDVALAFQDRQGRELPEIEKLHLGELLVEAGYITREQLDDAIERGRKSDKKLEDVLVEAGYAEPHHIAHGLRLQSMLITAALTAALTLAPVSDSGSAEKAAEGSPPSKATVTVTASVLARASLTVLHQSPEFVVTDADIQRGYVDVRAATKIEIKSNSGFMLVFESHGFPFKEAEVMGLDRGVTIGQGGGMVVHPEKGSYAIELNYRFKLYENAHPGTYNWPLSISISPM